MAGKAALLLKGLNTQEVRALLGEPDEIVTASGVGELATWKYCLSEDCKVLAMIAPTPDLFFIKRAAGGLADLRQVIQAIGNFVWPLI